MGQADSFILHPRLININININFGRIENLRRQNPPWRLRAAIWDEMFTNSNTRNISNSISQNGSMLESVALGSLMLTAWVEDSEHLDKI